MSCPICCAEFDDYDDFEAHYTDCSDFDFIPASALPTSGTTGEVGG